jgi:hypothetical protein
LRSSIGRTDSASFRLVAGQRVIARGPLGAGFTWAPHSRQLAVIVGGSLLAIDIGTGRRVRIDRDVRIWRVSFSPSGKKIVWARKTGKPHVTLGDVDLFSGSTNGGDHWRLTSDRGSDRPVWGRAGIAFARFEPFTLLHRRSSSGSFDPTGRASE